MTRVESTVSFRETLRDFNHIMEMARNSCKLPVINIDESIRILYSVRDDVNDLFSITASHFINAGATGLRHFHFLLSALIKNIDNSSLSELNDIWAMILYKGHSKDRENARSYRTISTCPLLAKCLDVYIGQRYFPLWKQVQAPTQFQGEGSSHELASLMLTESILYTIHTSKRPIFVIFLDAKSAFDVVVRQNVIVDAYKAGTQDQGLIYLNNRMENRRTFPQWGTSLLGPIKDKRGLEQGAVLSDRLYKLYNNSQLKEAQESGLGIKIGDMTIAAIGQADDCALISDCPVKLQCLLYLTSLHCERQHVELVPEKTNLLVWSPSSQRLRTNLLKLQCPITVDGHEIAYVDSAEHVGVQRSVECGNMPHIISRIANHKRAIGSLLHAGVARHHAANPSSCIHLQRVYGSGVLFSGLGSLVLNKREIGTISQHFRVTLCRLQKLPQNTPDCVVFFLAGSLPAAAILDLRMLSLLGMICRLGPSSAIQQLGRHMLLSKNKKSWFTKLKLICEQYLLPDPLQLFENPPSKESWKRLCNSLVISFWEEKLRKEAENLPSLHYFYPQFYSLMQPHRIWTTADNSAYEVKKAVTMATMLSGRYITDHRARHWSKQNPHGLCHLCLAASKSHDSAMSNHSLPLGSLEHLLLECPELFQQRERVRLLWTNYTSDKPLIRKLTVGSEDASLQTWLPNMQLLLDPSACPLIIQAAQEYGPGIYVHLYYLSRTWCHALHTRRIKILKLLNII